jgi:hypothetical protein
MNLSKLTIIPVCAALALSASAQNGVAVHGSVQSDILFPQEDKALNTGSYDDKVLTNTYADVGLYSKYVDAGLRAEFLEYPLPGYDADFKGWGVPNIYVKGKYKGLELTAGDFYEQFGSGFILRTYEERALGIDNSIRGGRLKVNSLRGLRVTALGGVQRRYWDWSTKSVIAGADAEFDLNEYIKGLAARNISWTVGASYVMKHEDDEDIIVPGTNYKLNLPNTVNAFDARTQFHRGGLNLLGEFAWKGQDPSYNNNYTYRHGNAVMVSATYSKTGWSALLQAKRSEDMSYRSQRSMTGTSAFLNNMPAFSYQHTYALASLYPYATQAAPGEWAFQGAFAYTFKRKTALGGKYGTKLKLNVSYIRGLHHTNEESFNNSLFGTNGDHTSFFKTGELYYQDINVMLDKKITSDFHVNFMYMNQRYNKTVVEGEGGMINSNILVLEPKYKISKKLTLRGEFQYLFTKQDQKDWAYGLLELSVLPYVMVTVSDQWNCGSTKTHYYMFGVTGNYRHNRLMLSYGRTRAGLDCSGGICRPVPATRGFRISYNYTF